MSDTGHVTTELIEEFTEWLGERGTSHGPAFAAHAETFLDWRGSAPLAALDEDDLREFLLGFCPRQVSMPADDSWEMCEAVAEFVCFLGSSGRLQGGPDRARRLMRTAVGLTEAMAARMADPASFGMAKSLFAGIAGADQMTEAELAAAMRRRVEEHNALPLEERKAATDRFFAPPPPLELPFLHVPPAEAEVAAVVAAAALPVKIRALREYLGEGGRALTAKGNLTLADGRALVELLGTGDEVDPKYGGKTFTTRTTAQLPQLRYLVELALTAGAVRHLKKRLVPVKAWTKKPPVDQAAELFETIVRLGVLSTMYPGTSFYSDMHGMLDDGVVHWLAALLAPDARADFDDIVELNRNVVGTHFDGEAVDYYVSGESVTRDISRIMGVLEMSGAVEWSGHREAQTDYGWGYRSGGTVALTAFGHLVVPNLLPEAGLALRTAADLTDADLTDLIAVMDTQPAEQHSAMLAAWKPSLPEHERAGAIAAMITEAGDAHTRLVGMRLLDMFDADVAAPHMRQLLDTAAAGHAAMWLLDHGLADGDAVGGFITPAVMIDILSLLVDDPDVLCRQFLAGHDPVGMLEFFWRHRAPETAPVLDVLGRHLPDRALAKSARKAALRHRSWMANGA